MWIGRIGKRRKLRNLFYVSPSMKTRPHVSHQFLTKNVLAKNVFLKEKRIHISANVLKVKIMSFLWLKKSWARGDLAIYYVGNLAQNLIKKWFLLMSARPFEWCQILIASQYFTIFPNIPDCQSIFPIDSFADTKYSSITFSFDLLTSKDMKFILQIHLQRKYK